MQSPGQKKSNPKSNVNSGQASQPKPKKVKFVNAVFPTTIGIGILAGVGDIIVTHLDVHPESTKKWITFALLATCLLALFLLSICTTIDQYIRAGYTFKHSAIELKKTTWYKLYILAVCINLTFFIPIIILITGLAKVNTILSAKNKALLSQANMIIATGCLIQALFTLLCFIIWFRNFNCLLANQSDAELLTAAGRGSSSLIEFSLSWLFFSAGFVVISLVLSDKISMRHALSKELVPGALFLVGAIMLFVSFMGGHPNSNCLKKTYLKISPLSCLFQCYFHRQFDSTNMLHFTSQIQTELPTNKNQNASGKP